MDIMLLMIRSLRGVDNVGKFWECYYTEVDEDFVGCRDSDSGNIDNTDVVYSVWFCFERNSQMKIDLRDFIDFMISLSVDIFLGYTKDHYPKRDPRCVHRDYDKYSVRGGDTKCRQMVKRDPLNS